MGMLLEPAPAMGPYQVEVLTEAIRLHGPAERLNVLSPAEWRIPVEDVPHVLSALEQAAGQEAYAIDLLRFARGGPKDGIFDVALSGQDVHVHGPGQFTAGNPVDGTPAWVEVLFRHVASLNALLDRYGQTTQQHADDECAPPAGTSARDRFDCAVANAIDPQADSRAARHPFADVILDAYVDQPEESQLQGIPLMIGLSVPNDTALQDVASLVAEAVRILHRDGRPYPGYADVVVISSTDEERRRAARMSPRPLGADRRFVTAFYMLAVLAPPGEWEDVVTDAHQAVSAAIINKWGDADGAPASLPAGIEHVRAAQSKGEAFASTLNPDPALVAELESLQ
ncbi:hypothetical protein ACQEVF_56945 [Nonomuraea polychroma]|uniref:hypothetical protein n=1 Tax=Nonomuraea polychroma TaxID=46176 RepID=UPI003D946304